MPGCSGEKIINAPATIGEDWTIMVYLDADNNLEEFAMYDIAEMMEGYINGQGLNLIVLIDRIAGYDSDSTILGEDFTGTRLYRIVSNGAERLSDNKFLNLNNSGDNDELNMGDALTLKKFIQFAKNSFPAKKYALILWDHGNGPYKKDMTLDITAYSQENSKSICQDDSSGYDSLYTAEITDVLSQDESVDLLGFDACLMGGIEIAYQYRPVIGKFSAAYMAASPPEEWGFGWDYKNILRRLRGGAISSQETDNIIKEGSGYEDYYPPATLTGEQLCGVIVEEQYDSTHLYSTNQALSCYDLSKASTVKTAVDFLAKGLASENEKSDFEALRGSSASTNIIDYFNENDADGWKYNPFFDLYDLCNAAGDSNDFSPEINSYAQAVKSAVDDMIIYSFGGSAYSGYTGFINGKNGIYIFFPDGDSGSPKYWCSQIWYTSIDYSSQQLNGYYGNLAWCADGATGGNGDAENWFELLHAWFDATGCNNYDI